MNTQNSRPSFNNINNTRNQKIYKIFIGCIPGNATDKSIEQVFSKYEGLTSIHLERRKNNKCSGYGRLETSSEQSYHQILKDIHRLGARQLSVLPFLEKTELIQSQLKFNKRRIVVAQLPHGTEDRHLVDHFSRFGKLEKGFVVKNKKDKELLPYGHIIFRTEAGAIAAKQTEHFILGKRVSIKTHKIDVRKKLQEIKKDEGGEGAKKSKKGRLMAAVNAPKAQRRDRVKRERGAGNFLLRKLDSFSSKPPRSLERGEDKECLFQEICHLGRRAALFNHYPRNLRFNRCVKRRGCFRQDRVARSQRSDLDGLDGRSRLRELVQRRGGKKARRNEGWSLF